MNKRVFEPSPSERKEKQLQDKVEAVGELQAEQRQFLEVINKRVKVRPLYTFFCGPETCQFLVTFRGKISVEEFEKRLERAFEC